MKKLFVLFLTVAMVFAMAVPGLAEEVRRAPLVRIAINDDVATLDPLGGNEQGRIMVLPNVFEYLCFLTSIVEGELQPWIAKEWEQIDDYTYRVTIYDYVHDSAGNPIKASDVAFSYNKNIEKGLNAAAINMISSVTAIDDVTVEFVLNTTAAGALLNTLTGTPIVSQAAYEADPEEMANNPIGSGAYVVTEYIPGSGVKLHRNENYWQTPELACIGGQQNVEDIEYQVTLEASQLTLSLETQTCDLAGYVVQTEADNFEDYDGFTIYSEPNLLSQVLLFNTTEGYPFANKELRQAVCYAVDNAGILMNIYNNKGGLCYTYGNRGYSDYQEAWESEDYYNYNVEKAKELREAAGYGEGELTVKIMTVTSTQHMRMGELLQAYLAQIGINSEIVSFDSSLYNPYRFDPEQWDVRIDNKGAGDYLSSVYKYSFDQDMYGGMTQNFYSDEHLQELLVTAMAEATHTAENINAFHQELKELAIGYGICYDLINYVGNDSVISDLTLNWYQKVMPGACEYVLD